MSSARRLNPAMIATAYPAIGWPGGMEWFWIFLIFLVLFGASALPKLFRSLGKSVREFKKAQDGLYDELDEEEKAARDKQRGTEDSKKASPKPPDSGPSSTTDA